MTEEQVLVNVLEPESLIRIGAINAFYDLLPRGNQEQFDILYPDFEDETDLEVRAMAYRWVINALKQLLGHNQILSVFKEWHTYNVHDFDSNCSCSRCETICDYLLEDWRDGLLTDEKIGEWYGGGDMYYEMHETVIRYTNKLRGSGSNMFSVNIDDPEFGAIFAHARKIGYSQP